MDSWRAGEAPGNRRRAALFMDGRYLLLQRPGDRRQRFAEARQGFAVNVITADNAYVMFEALRVDYGTLGPFGDHP